MSLTKIPTKSAQKTFRDIGELIYLIWQFGNGTIGERESELGGKNHAKIALAEGPTAEH